jgi:isopentenyl-diphosphate delta-isomerase
VQAGPSRLDAMVDVVDGHDQVVATAARRKLLPAGVNFRVVHIFLFNSQNELLLQLIAPGLRHEAMWGSSVAGYVHSGESYEAAAARKLRDELGVSIPLQSLGKTSMLDNSSTKFIGFYTCEYDGPLSPDPAQISALRFESLHAIATERQRSNQTFTPTFLYLLDHYLSGKHSP